MANISFYFLNVENKFRYSSDKELSQKARNVAVYT